MKAGNSAEKLKKPQKGRIHKMAVSQTGAHENGIRRLLDYRQRLEDIRRL